jgi:hypothetical protein
VFERHSFKAFGMMTPSFAENVPNITVVAGKDVVLPCIVDNLEHFKVRKMKLSNVVLNQEFSR